MAATLQRFLAATSEREDGGDRFQLQSQRIVRIDVDGGVWLRPDAAIAFRGGLSFERLPTLGADSLTDAALRELCPLVHARGRGRLFAGNRGSHVHVVELEGETIVVAWTELLAFEESLAFELSLVEHGVSVAAGGLFVVKLSGRGAVAICAHGTPLTLAVSPDAAVITDPHTTLAWSSGVVPAIQTELTWRSLFGHGGGEPIQLRFEGTGFVVVQSYENPHRLTLSKKSVDALVSRLAAL